ncbi:MAG: hypothetical protein ABR905_00790 [Terracidiphilus sp.]|jgi:5-hydroxyisourate hydrolase-like protein (transthyretin family)
MARWRWLWIPACFCLFAGGCDKHPAKKPDATKGAVTGVVICADTGKPARFATVNLLAVPKKDAKADDQTPAMENTLTDLDGRFKLEAVDPGQYLALATMEGYLDPERGIDLARLSAIQDETEMSLKALDQWKAHLVEVTVTRHRTAELTIQIERGAEINGLVTYDDGSPAIGMHFLLLRKAEKSEWSGVGLALFKGWSIDSKSDGHGHYSLTNLPEGEYKVCASMPVENEGAAPAICLGDTFRRKDAKITKLAAGETVNGVDIVIPLSGLHTVSGTVSVLADGHTPAHAKVRLLYADDREEARELSPNDGEFTFEYVPEGKYILQVTGAEDMEQPNAVRNAGNSDPAPPKSKAVLYADKEIPLTVENDLDDLLVSLTPAPPAQPAAP